VQVAKQLKTYFCAMYMPVIDLTSLRVYDLQQANKTLNLLLITNTNKPAGFCNACATATA